MASQRRTDFFIPLLTVLIDVVAFELAFLLAYWLRFYSPLTLIFPVTYGIPPLEGYIYGSFIFIPIWIIVFQQRKLYAARRNATMSDEFFAIVRVITIGMFIIMSATFFYRGFSYSRGVFILLWIATTGSIVIGRVIVNAIERRLYRAGRELLHVVLVGNGPTAVRIYDLFSSHPELGYRIVGYYADTPVPQQGDSIFCRYLGTVADLPIHLSEHPIDAALIALTSEQHTQLLELVGQTEGRNIDLMMVPDIFDLMTSRVRIQEIEGVPFIKIKEISLGTWDRITKRLFDIVVSLIVLMITLPITVLIAILIKLTSRGPIFYRQERIGLDGGQFQLVKFRTMSVDAEQVTGPTWTKPSDPRIIPIGRILRRTSLDELPQLINVLRGEMSLVGPRPERPFFVDQFKDQVPRYLERHRVKTGMTGWAQVNGLRGTGGTIDERTKYDIYYVENWSLVFDLKIILKTVREVIMGTNAH